MHEAFVEGGRKAKERAVAGDVHNCDAWRWFWCVWIAFESKAITRRGSGSRSVRLFAMKVLALWA